MQNILAINSRWCATVTVPYHHLGNLSQLWFVSHLCRDQFVYYAKLVCETDGSMRDRGCCTRKMCRSTNAPNTLYTTYICILIYTMRPKFFNDGARKPSTNHKCTALDLWCATNKSGGPRWLNWRKDGCGVGGETLCGARQANTPDALNDRTSQT